MRRRAGAWALAGVMAFGAGCAQYALRGKVIEGDISYVAVVDASDPRLEGRGLANVALDLVSDPERLNRKRIASGLSEVDGGFSLPVEEIGAGAFNYDVSLTARKDGYATAMQPFRLPPDSKRVLVILKRGRSEAPEQPESLMEEYRRHLQR